MKKTTFAAMAMLGTVALAYTAGPIYSAIVVPATPYEQWETYDYTTLNESPDPSPITAVQITFAPSPSKQVTIKKVTANEEPTEPDPEPTSSQFAIIEPDPINPSMAVGRYGGPSRSPLAR